MKAADWRTAYGHQLIAFSNQKAIINLNTLLRQSPESKSISISML